MNTFLQTHQKLASFSHRFFMIVHYFFGIDFRIFFHRFLMENGSQNGPANCMGGHLFSRPFLKVDFWMHFGRPLAHFGLPFGALWLPFGSLWLPFGFLWLPFSELLVPFGSLFAHPGIRFSQFCNLLAFRFFQIEQSHIKSNICSTLILA